MDHDHCTAAKAEACEKVEKSLRLALSLGEALGFRQLPPLSFPVVVNVWLFCTPITESVKFPRPVNKNSDMERIAEFPKRPSNISSSCILKYGFIHSLCAGRCLKKNS